MVPVTKYKKVIDRAERTEGTINKTAPSCYINDQANTSEALRNWTVNIAKQNSNKDHSEQINNDCLIVDLSGDNDSAFRTTKSTLLTAADSLCRKQIPGNRYSDFVITEFDCNYLVDINLIPLYKIKYTYNNKEYFYYANGTNMNDIYSENHPVDSEYSEINNKLTEEIKQLNSTISFLSKLTKYVLPIAIVIGIILMSILGIGSVLTGGCVLGEIICIIILKNNKNKIDKSQSELKAIRNERQNIRYEINQKQNHHCGSKTKKHY